VQCSWSASWLTSQDIKRFTLFLVGSDTTCQIYQGFVFFVGHLPSMVWLG
jgi:hypothetical protein